MSNPIPTKLKCPHCPQKFFANVLQEHIARCTSNKPYKCEICDQCFATEKGKNAHKGKAHTAEERGTLYKCKYCLHGSDSQTAMQKHELQHEEEGGLGFRSRSRSRGPARPSVSNSTNSAATPTRMSSSRARSYNSSTPRQRASSRNIQERAPSRSYNSSAPRQRAPSRNSSAPRQRASSRNFRETSTTTNSTNSTTMNWASMPPTTNNLLGIDTENRREAGSSAKGILPIRMIANGLLEIAVLNPEYAERRIAEYKRQFATTVNQLSAMNRRLREHCIAEGIPLTAEDFVEEKIQALKAKYPQIYGEPSGQHK